MRRSRLRLSRGAPRAACGRPGDPVDDADSLRREAAGLLGADVKERRRMVGTENKCGPFQRGIHAGKAGERGACDVRRDDHDVSQRKDKEVSAQPEQAHEL